MRVDTNQLEKRRSVFAHEASLIGFWRSVYRGNAPKSKHKTTEKNWKFSRTGLDVVRSDMTKACLDFLVTEGSLAELPQLAPPTETIAHLEKDVQREVKSTSKIQLRFSGEWLKIMVSVYNQQPYNFPETKEKPFTTADGIALVLLLERLYPLDGSPSLILRSGYFAEDVVSRLIAAVPLAGLHFFDRLGDYDGDLESNSTEETALFLEILGVLTPYTAKRWLNIENKLWRSNGNLDRIARLCAIRGRFTQEVAELCRKNDRLENLTFFADLTKNSLSKEFFDVDRAWLRIENKMTNGVRQTLYNLQPNFRSFYRNRPPYPFVFLEVAGFLDALEGSEAIERWQPTDVLSFLFDLPENRVDSDLGALVKKDKTLNSDGLLLITKYLRNFAANYLSDFFTDTLTELIDRLSAKFEKLPEERKKGIKTVISKNLTELDPELNVHVRIFSYWLLSCKVRSILEDSLIDEDKNTAFVKRSIERRRQEIETEKTVSRIIEDRFDNIYSWKLGLDLQTNQQQWQLMETILDGYAFVDVLIDLDKWKNTLDLYDEKELLQRTKALQVLERISHMPEEKHWFFERYYTIRDVIGYTI
ncbi:MAG: hypothetical protein GY866_39070 [Proteobacteria bacterium]|nr:hypothetical protein [Pseudomonadota bacterium]